MDRYPVLKITSADVLGHSVNVSLDGVPLTSVMDLVLHIDAQHTIRATLTMEAIVDAELPADVTTALRLSAVHLDPQVVSDG